jgi:transposase
MLTQEEDVEAKALRARGWSISAIARHLGRDRKTVRAYLNGERLPGRRVRPAPDEFERFAEYCRLRFADDPHVWATALFDEVRDLGYVGGYSSFTRAVRAWGLRPRCEACAASGGPDEYTIIDHPAGEETQWDWLELPDPPASWGWGGTAHLLVGALPYSSRWRGWLAPNQDQPHLVEGLHQVSVRLGGLSREWRFDRMSTVCVPATGELTASFAEVARYYGMIVRVCPSRRGWRKGSVEKANHSAAQRWWRTLADEVSVTQAQASLDTWCTRRGDVRVRMIDGTKMTVATAAVGEPLRPMPATPFPAILTVDRVVSAQALVAWRGNEYSVPPGHAGQTVTVRSRLGEQVVEVVTAAGTVLARHHREPDHAGVQVRAVEHVAALERKVLAARAQASGQGPCRPKQRKPPSQAALAEAARLRGDSDQVEAPVVDFAAYAAAARPLGTKPADPAGQAPTQQ